MLNVNASFVFANTKETLEKVENLSKTDQSYIYFDENNRKITLPFQCEEVTSTNNYYQYLLKINGKYYYYKAKNNNQEEKLIKIPYQNVIYKNGVIVIDKNGKKAGFSVEKEQVVTPFFDDIVVKAGYKVYQDKKVGVYSKEGKLIAKPIYKDVEFFDYKTDYLICEKFNDKFDFIYNDKNANEIYTVVKDVDVIDTENTIDTSNTKIFPYKIGNKWGFLYKRNFEKQYTVIPCEYDSIKYFVILYKSKRTKVTLSEEYISDFVIVKNGEKEALLNLADNSLTAFFDSIDTINIQNNRSYIVVYETEPFIKIKSNEKYALYNLKTKEMSKFKYDDIFYGKIKRMRSGAKYVKVKKNHISYYQKPLNVAGTCTGYTLGAAIALPFYPIVIVTTTAGFIWLCIDGKP